MKKAAVPSDSEDEGDHRRFFVEMMAGVLKRPVGKIVASQEGVVPPANARIAACFRCTVVLEGRLWQRSDLGSGVEEFGLRAGDVFLMRPETWREPMGGPRRSILIIHFQPRHLSLSHYRFNSAVGGPGVRRNFSTSRGLPPAAGHLLEAVAEYTRQRPFPTSCKALVHCLLHQAAEVLRSDELPLSKAEITFLALCHYVQERFREAISRESVARHLQIHPAHVSRLFRSVGDTTFQKYVLQRRLKYAVGLLARPSLGIKEVAAASGFQNPDYFREVFCRATGKTPQVYRSSLIRRPNRPAEAG